MPRKTTQTTKLKPADSRYKRGTQGGQVTSIETGQAADILLPRLTAVDADLQEMRKKRDGIVPAEIELPDGLPDLYREMVADLAATLSQEAVAGRAADELHDLVDRIVVDWDADASAHRLTVEGNLLEILHKSAPRGLDAVGGGAIFAEVGCGSRI